MNYRDNNISAIFELCLIAAQMAGKYVFDQLYSGFSVGFKGRTNIVTKVDQESEKQIISMIRNSFPDHRILAEESLEYISDSPYRWIIDPLDGTTNYIHGYPFFSVSIAVEYNGEIIVGVVYDPCRNELFSAAKNGGAYLNNNKIQVSNTKTLLNSLLATGFPYETDEIFENNMAIFSSVYKNCQGVRRAGSAALDLCYVASGRLDGFWEFKLNPWDVSAGALIIQEAGGTVKDIFGNDFNIKNCDQIIATNGLIHKELLEMITSIV